jgi:dihydrodipicolinate synthase/N-acetylneuraminate lyase
LLVRPPREYVLVRRRELWKHLWAISDFLESVNYVAGIKAGLELIGQPVGPARLPIQPLPAEERERFAGILRAAGVLPAVAA